MATILILKGDKPNEVSEAHDTFKGLSEIGNDTYHLVEYKQLLFVMNNEDYLVYYRNQTGERVDVAGYDLTYIRDFAGYEFERNCVAHYLSVKQKKFVNSDVAHFQHISKLTQQAQFVTKAIPAPASVYAHASQMQQAIEEHLTYPVIVKAITGNSGRDNHLVRDADELSSLLADNSAKYIVQEFIPNDSDYRFIVLGDTVSCVYQRKRRSEGEHRNNVSQGGEKIYLSLDDVPQQHKALAIKAASSVGREICGVDLMVNKETGELAVLEANFNFGIRAVPGVVSDELYGLAEYLHTQATS